MLTKPLLRPGVLWTALPRYQPRSIMDVIGCPINLRTERDWVAAAEMLSIYADPRYETVRYIMVRNRRISDHIAISAQTPNCINVSIHDWMTTTLKMQMNREDPYVLFMHNHPSGLVVPSDNDINITKYLHWMFTDFNEKERLLGHLIVGGNGTASYSADGGKNWMGIKDSKTMPLDKLNGTPNFTNCINVLGKFGMDDLLNYVKSVAEASGIDPVANSIMVYTNISGFVTGMRAVDNDNMYLNLEPTLKASFFQQTNSARSS